MSETSIIAAKESERYYPYSSSFYANRHSFWLAGQNSWTLPPAQDQDAFLQLVNVEPVLQGILQRRRGYQLFSNISISGAGSTLFTRSYSFRSDGLSLFRVVLVPSTANGILGPIATDESGTVVLNPIYPSSPSQQFEPRMVLSRDIGYFTDGTASGMRKWDGTVTNPVRSWGTSVTAQPIGTFGPNNTGTGADVPSSGGVPWGSPTNIQGPPDGNFASVTVTGFGSHSDNLQATNFGFNVPAASTVGPIAGITVTIQCFFTGTLTNPESINVNLIKGGTVLGQSTFLVPPPSNGQVVLALTGSELGGTFLNTDVNASNFGVNIEAFSGGSDNYTLNIDSVAVTIICAGGGITFTTSTATTNIVLLNGRTYTYAFQNSKALTTSDLGTFSVSTGPLIGNQVNLANIPASTDPQVDTVLILATADGNDETTLYLLGSVPNGVSTFTDTIPDALSATYTSGPTLLTQPLYQDTDAFGSLHGLAGNTPPPTGLNFPVKHKGRIYGANGHTLYFSKNLDDVTTADGLITCRWEEAWPAVNQFDVSSLAETVQALISDGETLWIGTERSVRRLIGDSPDNFQLPEIEFNEAGVYNQEVWKVGFVEGQPVGTFWLTPDFKVMMSDFNTYTDIGTPVQDVLNTITPRVAGITAPVVHASFVSRGPASYYMLYLPTNGNTTPNICLVFDIKKGKWFTWVPTDIATTSLFFIDHAGNPRWLFSSPSTNVLLGGDKFNTWEWTFGIFTDRTGSAPTTYPVTIQTTWLDMGDYGLRKFVNQIIPTTADNQAMTIMVEAASNEQDFNNPAIVVPATTVIPAPIPDDVFVPLASGPGHHRSFRFTFTSPASTIQDVLTGYSIESGVLHRY